MNAFFNYCVNCGMETEKGKKFCKKCKLDQLEKNKKFKKIKYGQRHGNKHKYDEEDI